MVLANPTDIASSLPSQSFYFALSDMRMKLGLSSQTTEKLASKLYLHSMNYAAKRVRTTRHALFVPLSTLVRSQLLVKPAVLLIPIDLIFILLGEFYGTRYQSSSLSLINVGSGFHYLRSFFFFFYVVLMGVVLLNHSWQT